MGRGFILQYRFATPKPLITGLWQINNHYCNNALRNQ